MTNIAIASGKVRRAVLVNWPFAVLLIGLLALEYLFPTVLTQRYFNNIYITDDHGQTVFIFLFLGGISGFDERNWIRLSAFWLWLAAGSLVAAAAANAMFADALPRFYLTSAIIIERVGAICGFAARPDFLGRVRRHIFDPPFHWPIACSGWRRWPFLRHWRRSSRFASIIAESGASHPTCIGETGRRSYP